MNILSQNRDASQGLPRCSRALLIPLVLIVVFAREGTLAHAQTSEKTEDRPAAGELYDVLELSLLQADDSKRIVGFRLPHDQAVELMNQMLEKAPRGKTYAVTPSVPATDVWQMLKGHQSPGDATSDYKTQIQDLYARLKAATDDVRGGTKSLTESEFNKVNAQIDEYNKLREAVRSGSGSYFSGAPALGRLQPGDRKRQNPRLVIDENTPKTTGPNATTPTDPWQDIQDKFDRLEILLKTKVPSPTPSSDPTSNSKRPTSQFTPASAPNSKASPTALAPSVPFPTAVRPTSSVAPPPGPAVYNPRPVTDDKSKVAAPKGVAMRVGIDRGTLERAAAPPSVIAAIRADKE